METVFWISMLLILYTYLGYALILYALGNILRWGRSRETYTTENVTDSLTVIVAAYNEAGCIEEKVKNTLALTYPDDKISFVFVTDGSTDGTNDIIAKYPQIKLLHSGERTGKISAIHRAMKEVQTELVVFTDANTLLNRDALLLICRHYRNKKTGAVAGEKRMAITQISDATAGEGVYWKYESKIKKWESGLYSVLGAAGELFSIRSSLYEPVAPDTILDDFVISMKISLQGYRIKYEPSAYGIETGSANVSEELKRKIRIAAGGIQCLLRFPEWLFIYQQPLLSFEYISHRVLRWMVTPYLLIMSFILNGILINKQPDSIFLKWLFILQFVFYAIALLGWVFKKRQVKYNFFYLPFYFCLMNYAMIGGMLRYLFSGQSILWEKATRKNNLL